MRGTFKMAVKRASIASASGIAAPWEPAIVLPSQVTRGAKQHRTPEMRLVAALLEDALWSITRRAAPRNGRRRREFIEAWNWLWSERRDWPFAFKNVCDFLALDASAVRHCVQRTMTARGADQLHAANCERVSLPVRRG